MIKGITQKEDLIIKNILKAYTGKFYAYGSRVKGTAQKYSDVDIAIKCQEKIPFDKFLTLKAFFEDSTFPYQVDLIDLDSISEKFSNLIKDDLVEI